MLGVFLDVLEENLSWFARFFSLNFRHFRKRIIIFFKNLKVSVALKKINTKKLTFKMRVIAVLKRLEPKKNFRWPTRWQTFSREYWRQSLSIKFLFLIRSQIFLLRITSFLLYSKTFTTQ